MAPVYTEKMLQLIERLRQYGWVVIPFRLGPSYMIGVWAALRPGDRQDTWWKSAGQREALLKGIRLQYPEATTATEFDWAWARRAARAADPGQQIYLTDLSTRTHLFCIKRVEERRTELEEFA